MLANRLKAFLELSVLIAEDVLSLLCIFKLSAIIKADVLPVAFSMCWNKSFFIRLPDIWWIFFVWEFLFFYEGLYTKRFSFWDEIKALWKVSFFATLGIFTIVSVGKLGDQLSRTVIVLMGLLSLPLLPAARIGSKKILRKTGLFIRKTIILGAGDTGRMILKALRSEPNQGYRVVGFLDDAPEKVDMYIDGIKVYRGIQKAEDYIRQCNIRDIFIAMPDAEKESIQELINRLQHKVERIFFIPDISGLAVLGTNLHHFFQEQTIALEIKNSLENPLNIIIKRLFDFIVSILLLIFLCLPVVIIALLIKLDSPGPAIFSQERIGRNGRRIKCYKFRTMYEDAEERLKDLLEKDERARQEWETYWKIKDDPRITRIGSFLRKTSLDELPQLFNVLKGEMSLIGPRPYLPEEFRQIGEKISVCLSVLPGITGLWQVSGRSNTNYEYRVALDLWYVRNWNLWLDVVILFKTIKVVLRREGAF